VETGAQYDASNKIPDPGCREDLFFRKRAKKGCLGPLYHLSHGQRE
jgi:hypothetical protein